jgi:hypothetical protein
VLPCKNVALEVLSGLGSLALEQLQFVVLTDQSSCGIL